MSLNKATYETQVDYCFSDKTIKYEPVVTKVHNYHVLQRVSKFMQDSIYWETGLRFSHWYCEFHPELLKELEFVQVNGGCYEK